MTGVNFISPLKRSIPLLLLLILIIFLSIYSLIFNFFSLERGQALTSDEAAFNFVDQTEVTINFDEDEWWGNNVNWQMYRKPDGWNLRLQSVIEAPHDWFNYVSLPILTQPDQMYYLSYKADGPHRVLLLSQTGQIINFEQSQLISEAEWTIPFRSSDNVSRIIFYLVNTTPGSVVHFYELKISAMNQADFDEAISSASIPDRIGPWSDVLADSKNYLSEPHMEKQLNNELPYQDEIVSTFTRMGLELKNLALTIENENDPKLIYFLKEKYLEALPLLRLMTNSDNQEVLVSVFASNLAHFSVKFSNNGGIVFKDILIRGDGTCWQQVVVARIIANALANTLLGNETFKLAISYSDQFGHTLLLGPNSIIDVSNNVAIFTNYKTWLSVPKYQRLKNILNQTYYSYFGPSAMLAFGKEYLLAEEAVSVNDYYNDSLARIPFISIFQVRGYGIYIPLVFSE